MCIRARKHVQLINAVPVKRNYRLWERAIDQITTIIYFIINNNNNIHNNNNINKNGGDNISCIFVLSVNYYVHYSPTKYETRKKLI